jgi:type IV secretory pathway component VirB8
MEYNQQNRLPRGGTCMKNSSLKKYDSEDTTITYIHPNNHIQKTQNLNLKQNLTSVSKSHWLLSLITVSVAFAVIPLFPILIAFVVGHWLSKQNK